MKIISRREFNNTLGRPGRPRNTYSNPDESVVIFDAEHAEICARLNEVTKEDFPKPSVMDMDSVQRLLAEREEPNDETQESTPVVEEVAVEVKDERGTDREWKSRTLATLSSNTANMQSLKKIMKEIVQKL